MPCSAISKQPTSSAGPYRFLVARTIRKPECRSPSKASTTSTRCSSSRGPAIAPSLVTCPIDDHGHAACAWPPGPGRAVTSRTWVTPPGEPSASAVPMVCTESTHQQRRVHLLDVAEHRAEVGLGGEEEPVGERVGPPGPQPHLGGGLLAGHVERRPARLGPATRHLEQQRRLADSGLAGQQHHRARHQPVAEHPVQLADPGQRPGGGIGRHLRDRHRLAPGRRGLDRRQLRRARLDHAAPGLALTAAADPAGASSSRTRCRCGTVAPRSSPCRTR